MTIKQAFELVYHILQTMQSGEIRLFVKNGEIKHVNRTEEVYPKRYDPQNCGKITSKDVRP